MKRGSSLTPTEWTWRTDHPDAPAPLRGRAIPGEVPGSVHGALLSAGLIRDIDDGDAERELAWIGCVDWTLSSTLPLIAGPSALVLDGLDTIARVRIGDRTVLEAANMFHPHRISLDPGDGGKPLSIEFRGPLTAARELEAARGARPVNGDWGPYSQLRKMACSFGWDWGPMAPTCAIWNGAFVEPRAPRIAAVRPSLRTVEGTTGVVDVDVDFNRPLDEGVELEVWFGAIKSGGEARVTAPCGATSVRVTVEIARLQAWWPRGYGQAALYDFRVELRRGERVVDRHEGRTGLRTVRLDTSTGFALLVNGVPVFAHGANWIPEGLFPERCTNERIAARIEQAAAANCNMLRVWGGGRYESRAFYEACDARGIMVWQDFMFACATYPEDDDLAASIDEEARYQVARLAVHPSIVLWCGGNENLLAWDSWGWKDEYPADLPIGERYWLRELPAILAELDPSRPYWPDSPYSGERDRHPNDPEHGDRHTWDARVDDYRELVPRFVSEFGHQSPPSRAALAAAVGADALRMDHPALAHRQRAWGGDAHQYGILEDHFGATTSFDQWHHRAQVLQARAMQLACEWWRGHRPHCMGALIWQLNDVWTGHSWSLIDVTGQPKPAWYAVRRACAPRVLGIHPVNGAATVLAINDTDDRWSGAVEVERVAFDGSRLRAGVLPLDLAPRSAAFLGAANDAAGALADTSAELFRARIDDLTATAFGARDRDLMLPVPRFSLTAETATSFRLSARSLLRDVVVDAGAVAPGARCSDQLFNLLPGESVVLEVEGPPVSAEALANATRSVTRS